MSKSLFRTKAIISIAALIGDLVFHAAILAYPSSGEPIERFQDLDFQSQALAPRPRSAQHGSHPPTFTDLGAPIFRMVPIDNYTQLLKLETSLFKKYRGFSSIMVRRRSLKKTIPLPAVSKGQGSDVLREHSAIYCNLICLLNWTTGHGALIHTGNYRDWLLGKRTVVNALSAAAPTALDHQNVIALILRPSQTDTGEKLGQTTADLHIEVMGKKKITVLGVDRHWAWSWDVLFFLKEKIVVALEHDNIVRAVKIQRVRSPKGKNASTPFLGSS